MVCRSCSSARSPERCDADYQRYCETPSWLAHRPVNPFYFALEVGDAIETVSVGHAIQPVAKRTAIIVERPATIAAPAGHRRTPAVGTRCSFAVSVRAL